MTPHMQNPGVQAGVSRDQLGCCSRVSFTAPDWRWQHIAERYHLPPSMAQQVVLQCFGEASDD
ncbi:hypothetical protein [uncultured Parasphingopyxis sp.]|uniref:hypothetical protein n=1 Tax=uncultured Parasphingopyxis sp. TaxID=1547918 RepID=UPI002622F444|nr:hypothetical protein [uncultured Parasphingopyxis sp.]